MTLIKKTIVLSKNGTKGYVTVVRVGSSTGIKIVMDNNISGLVMGLKIGNNRLIVKELTGIKTEFNLGSDLEFNPNDELACMILDGGGKIYAEGGLRSRIQLRDIIPADKPAVTDAPVKKIVLQNEKPLKNENTKYNNNQPAEYEIIENAEKLSQNSNFLKDKNKSKIQSDEYFRVPKDIKNFYYSVKDKLEELFVVHPREEMLEKMIPSSKWVRINYDGDDYYVAGELIDENGSISHIAYGVPGYEGINPPKETEGICDWLPIKDMKKFHGYWLIFQSAETGEILPKD